jgi:hypothetical protein
MNRLSAAMLFIAGLIHLIPLQGVVSATLLSQLYGVSVAEPNVEILLRHRAVMFGLLGLLLVAAALVTLSSAVAPEFAIAFKVIAYAAGLISAASFLLVACLVGGYNALIGRVVAADVVALVCLLVGVAAEWRAMRAQETAWAKS